MKSLQQLVLLSHIHAVVFYSCYLVCLQVPSTFYYIFGLLYSFLSPCVSFWGSEEHFCYDPVCAFPACLLGISLQISGERVVLSFTIWGRCLISFPPPIVIGLHMSGSCLISQWKERCVWRQQGHWEAQFRSGAGFINCCASSQCYKEVLGTLNVCRPF